ncbi:hypothetical protein BGX38DRAFT_411724, partial [Terfezia claveryi]
GDPHLSDSLATEREKRRLEEWATDVPLIGNVYVGRPSVVIYLNGLGRPFRAEGWDNPRHWLNRAWTLQETTDPNSMVIVQPTPGTLQTGHRLEQASPGPYTTDIDLWSCKIDSKGTTLREAILTIFDSSHNIDVARILQTMQRRYASNPTDKVAGLAFPLRHFDIDILPVYRASESPSQAWDRLVPCVASMQRYMPCFYPCCYETGMSVAMQLLRLFPHPSVDHWFPSWEQVMRYPDVSLAALQRGYETELPPRTDRSLRLYNARIYRECIVHSAQLLMPAGNAGSAHCIVIKRGPDGQLQQLTMASPSGEIPSELLDTTYEDRQYVLVDITTHHVTNQALSRLRVPMWKTHLILICRELSPFQLPQPTLAGFEPDSARPQDTRHQFHLRRVTTLEWTPPELVAREFDDAVKNVNEENCRQLWLPFKADVRVASQSWHKYYRDTEDTLFPWDDDIVFSDSSRLPFEVYLH